MDDKVFGLLEKMYSDLASRIDGLNAEMKQSFNKLESRMEKVENQLVKIENIMEPKLQALFDGQKQHTDILGRIEEEVVRHEEFILKRIK